MLHHTLNGMHSGKFTVIWGLFKEIVINVDYEL